PDPEGNRPGPIGMLDLLDQIAEAVGRADRPTVLRERRREAIDADFHGFLQEGGACLEAGRRSQPPAGVQLYLDSRYLDVKMVQMDSSRMHLWLVLMKAHRTLARHARRSIAPLGLGASDFAILELLLHRGRQPVNAIGRRVDLTSGAITSAID